MRFYGSNLLDAISVCKHIKKVYDNATEVYGYCEIKPGKKAFEQLLADVTYGETVIIKALAALGDDNSTVDGIAEKVRALCSKGIFLKVIVDEDFSYESFEVWYNFNKKHAFLNGVWYKNYYVPEGLLFELDPDENIPYYDRDKWVFEENCAIWHR